MFRRNTRDATPSAAMVSMESDSAGSGGYCLRTPSSVIVFLRRKSMA